jgi:hypothetical protein
MEAMTIESLLLSVWEEDGFVGKTRVPVGSSDLDVLAIHAGQGKVRIGETKVREGSQKVYVVDPWNIAEMKKQGTDFAAWLDGDNSGWAKWLHNLPNLWKDNSVPWLLDRSRVREIEVVFCCNLVLMCEQQEADAALQRAVIRYLGVDSSIEVRASVKPTFELVTDLIRKVFARIDDQYGRRFGDNFKDLFREIHRYLDPQLDRLVWDENGQHLGGQKKKKEHHEEIRKRAVLELLRALGIKRNELVEWSPELGN